MTIDNSSPAFARSAYATSYDTAPAQTGMSLRDYFAAKALQGILAAEVRPVEILPQQRIAEQAYMIADAMLAAREAK